MARFSSLVYGAVVYGQLSSREQTWQILEEVERVAREGERSVAQVAIR